jgi:hypothetical protein
MGRRVEAIKAVEMVRKIRDENCERSHNLSREEQLRQIHEEAFAKAPKTPIFSIVTY